MVQKISLIEQKDGEADTIISSFFPRYVKFTTSTPIKIEKRKDKWVWLKESNNDWDKICHVLSEKGCKFMTHLIYMNESYKVSFIISFKDDKNKTYKEYENLGVFLCKTYNVNTFIYKDADISVIDRDGDLCSWLCCDFFDDDEDDYDEMPENKNFKEKVYVEKPSTFLLESPLNNHERTKNGELFFVCKTSKNS